MKILTRIVFLISLLVFFKIGNSQNSFIKELQKGDEYCNGHNYENAIIHYQNYLDQSKTLGKYRNFETEANVNRKIAYAYSTSGKYIKTINHLKEALRIDSIENNRLAFAEDIRLLGMAYAYSNDYEKAMFYLERAIGLTERFSKSIKEDKLQTLANTFLSLSQIHATLGDFTLSRKYVLEALTHFQKIRDEYGLAQALNHLAWLQIEEGNYKEAEKNLDKSIAYYNKLKMFTFEQYNAISDISEKGNKYEDALRYRLVALAQADSSKILPQRVWSTIRVGDAYKALGQCEKAKNYYIQAKKLNSEIDHSNMSPAIDYRTGYLKDASQSYLKNKIKYGAAITSLKLGDLFRDSYPDSAMSYYNQSLALFESFENKEHYNNALIKVSSFLNDLGKSEKALENLRLISNTTKDLELKWQMFFAMGKAYENLAMDSLAIVNYKNAIDIIERLRGTVVIEEFRDSYFSDKIVVYDQLIQILQKNGKAEEAWSFSEKARARSFLDLIAGQKIGASQSVDSVLIKQEQNLNAEISFLFKSMQQEATVDDSTRAIYPVLNKKLKEKQAEYDKLIDELKLSKSKYFQLITARTLDLREVQNRIKENNVIVTYKFVGNNLRIDVITRDSFVTRIEETSELDLNNTVTLFRSSINQSEELVRSHLSSLYDLIWKPIEKDILQGQKVCIVPNQCLHYVPFAALYNGNYLIENQFIHYSVSAALYKDENMEKSEDRFLGIALKNSNVGNFQPILGTEQEVKLIQQFFTNSTLILDEKTNETSVKESMPEATIIHFATHGYYDEEHPLESFLALNSDSKNDGRLTVYEIFNSDINSKLTTLSACDTGIGKLSKGDDIVSLNRAFLYAGSSNVISSLWSINDRTTPKLMSDLYFYYNQNHSFEESLCLAQRDFIKKTSSNPKLWSAFVLYN